MAFFPIRLINTRTICVDYNLKKTAFVKCELLTLAGRRADVLFSGNCSEGKQAKVFRVGSGTHRIAYGVYLLVVSIDGEAVAHSKYFFQRSIGN
jgi:hypothetical protein